MIDRPLSGIKDNRRLPFWLIFLSRGIGDILRENERLGKIWSTDLSSQEAEYGWRAVRKSSVDWRGGSGLASNPEIYQMESSFVGFIRLQPRDHSIRVSNWLMPKTLPTR